MSLDPKIYNPLASLGAQWARDNMSYPTAPTGPTSAVTGATGPTGPTGSTGSPA